MRTILSLSLVICLATLEVACASKTIQRSVLEPEPANESALENSNIAPATDSPEDKLSAERVTEIVYNLPVPTEAKGSLRIRNFGITQLTSPTSPKDSTTDSMTTSPPKDASATTTNNNLHQVPAVHIELIVENRSAPLNWTIDTRTQELRIENQEPQRPAFVRAKSDELPFITIAPGSKQTVDLFYLLPSNIHDPGDMQRLTLDWQIIADDKVVENETAFTEISRDTSAIVMSKPNGVNNINVHEASSAANPSEATSSGSTTPPSDPKTQPEPGESWWQDPFVNVPEPWKDILR